MSMPLRPIAFQVAASMVLWECYCNLGKPTKAAVDHGAVLRVVLPKDLPWDSDEAKELAIICHESVESAPPWLEKEGLIRRAGYQSLEGTEWELTMRGVAALSLKLRLDSEVPDKTVAGHLSDLLDQVRDEAKGRASGWVLDGFGSFFGQLMQVMQSAAQ